MINLFCLFPLNSVCDRINETIKNSTIRVGVLSTQVVLLRLITAACGQRVCGHYHLLQCVNYQLHNEVEFSYSVCDGVKAYMKNVHKNVAVTC